MASGGRWPRSLLNAVTPFSAAAVRRGRSITFERSSPKPHDFYAVDVSSDEAVKSWASVCLSSHEPPDLLINNAGVINKNARLWEVDASQFSQVVDVNLKGPANVIRILHRQWLNESAA